MSSARITPYYVSVLLDHGLNKPLDYSSKNRVEVGMRVLVPVQNSLRKGTVIELKETSSVSKVYPIDQILSEDSLVSKELMKLAKWMSEYYCTPLRKVLRVILPATIRKETKEKMQLFVKRLISVEKLLEHCRLLQSKSPSQAKILEVLLKAPKGLLLTELLEKSGSSKSPIETLAKKGVISLAPIQINRSPLEDLEFFQTSPKTLSDEQASALDRIICSLENQTFQTHLIHGVTGSGKTEIYLQAISHARKKGLGVILLVPEIALTTQTIERLKSRFTEKLGILHHRLSDGERFDIWHSIRKGEISIVVGARSAIFCPVNHLGLIIVDEEHESSYKQMEEQPCYHARDMAIVRGHFSKATVVLGSATPSLESYHNAKKGKYVLSVLKKRAKAASLPKVQLVNMKQEWQRAGGYTLFSEPLLEAIKTRYQKGEQSLLFLNRRGYHTFQLCTSCDQTVICPHCDVSLTFHKRSNLLSCHLCGFVLSPPPTCCPYCKQAASLRFKGVGTELVERTLHRLFPDIRTLRMDADTTRHKGSHDLLFKSFRSGKADVLIGTQMIAKGLHFPAVTFVGVLNSDSALNLPDFRSSEWVFQLLTQVSGRAGRGDLQGEVIIQTCMPNHPLFSLASKEDYPAFFEREILSRELFSYPPYKRLAKVTFSGADEKQVFAFAQTIREALVKILDPSYEIFPIIPSGIAKIKDQFRFKLLLKGEKSQRLSIAIQKALEAYPHRYIRTLVDIDPLSTFS
jgi:primosomal protein N' (replication factor Y)